MSWTSTYSEIMEKIKNNPILFLSMAILCSCTVPGYTTHLAMPTPSTTPEVCDTSEKEMCLGLNRLRNQTLSSPGTVGSCSVSDDCTNLSCSLTVSYSGFQIPLSLKITLHPCSVPYKVHLAVSSPLLGEVVNDDFTESRTIAISVFGTSADVIVTLTQHCYGVTISNAVLIGGNRLDFISPANISMFCDRSSYITMATRTMLSIPVATAYSPTTTTPTTTPLLCDTSKEEMCSSLYSLRNQTLSSSGTAGSCSVSNDCTSLSCSLTVSYSGFQVPLSLRTTLLPCSVPYKVHLVVSSPLLGEVVNDDFTESRTITISVFGASTDVIVTLTQQCFGVTISNTLLIGGSRLDFISTANLYMFCDRSTSITTATSPMLSVAVTTAYSPTTTTPTLIPTTTTPPTTPPLLCNTSKGDMCSSLYSLRNQTLSSPGTAGSCSVSDDCTNLSCSLTVSYSGFQIPLSLKITLHPCSVPYKVHLAVSSPLLGEVVNDDFTESRTIAIRVFGTSADVIVTLTQQCYGVTISNAVLIGGNRLDLLSPANIYMFCDRSSYITMATSTILSLPMTTTLISTATTPSVMPAPSPSPTVACTPEFNVTPSVTYDAVNQTLNIVHYPPEGSVCKCVFRKMEKKKPCLPRDTMSGVQLRKNEKGRLVITCKAGGSSYKLSMRVKNE